MDERLIDLISAIVPFRYLRGDELRALLGDSRHRQYSAGEVLIEQGDPSSDEVFVLVSGSVESVDSSRTPPFRMNVIESGSYFGERSCLLGHPRLFEMRALEDSACLVIPGQRFLRLIAESRSFAQAFGVKLREGLGLFEAFDRFNAEILRSVALGNIDVRRLVEQYKAIEPALHPLVNDEASIDWAALAYAVRRLPNNLTRTFVFLLTDNLPTVYASPDRLFPFVATEARHRFIYEMMGGKDMVLIRDGLSDLVDFVTCLCIFAVEARKIRYRLNHPDLLVKLVGSTPSRREADRLTSGCGRRASDVLGADSGSCQDPAEDAALASLPFDQTEREELKRIWPVGTSARVRDIVFHRQAFSVDVRKQVNNYNSRLAELWASQVGAAAERLTGARPSDFPEELEVHIISSNTHSVSNCLNPFFARHKEAMLEWAQAEGLREPGWHEAFDEVYNVSRQWLGAFPERRTELAATESDCGIIRLPETITTGIQVQLIDAAGVCDRAVDPWVKNLRCPERALIVNIDYAFGEQAEEIMRSLLLLFGHNVRSLNVLGKAGSLVGSRGDILLPTAFVEQANDAFQPLPGEGPEVVSRLERALPGRSVHCGPLLTVGGTLLQNRDMLQFYNKIWSCIGLEMEGIWYLRALLEAEELGVLRSGARRRFLYYVSDLPLASGQSLSERMSPVEGIPPLYAITREVLSGLFGAG
ncbi:MAG TPA: cyclic nucleotide-binding domain-containing protein [Rectinemataceae bacterium]|nr:cyclic nucleotide-binding domain-containing protein [Rectinemataceae bacterium]